MSHNQESRAIFDYLNSYISQLENDEKVSSDVKSTVEKLHSPDITDNVGRTLLHIAAATANKDMIEILINSGCSISVKDNLGTTPLLTLLVSRQLNDRHDVVKLLLGENVEIIADTNDAGLSPLSVAVRDKNMYIIKIFYEWLKRRGLSYTEIHQKFLKIGVGDFPLALVIHLNDPIMIRMFLENRKSIEDFESANLIETAMEMNYVDIVGVLLQFGPGIQERKVHLCWNLSRRLGHSEFRYAKPYIERIISWNAITEESVESFENIFRFANKEAVEMLLEHSIDLYVKKTFGMDLLIYLCFNTFPGRLELLRSRKIDVHARGVYDQTCLHLAAGSMKKWGDGIEIIEYLLDEGADPNTINTFGVTPLRQCQNIRCFVLLVQYGADIQIGASFRFYSWFEAQIHIAHIALIEACGTMIRQSILDEIKSSVVSNDIYLSRHLEIDKMKGLKIFESFTVFTILTQRPEKIADSIRDQSALSSLLDCVDESWNSYYACKLRFNVSRALQIIDWRKKAVAAIYSCTDHLFSPDHLVLDVIVSFLTYKDLRVFA